MPKFDKTSNLVKRKPFGSERFESLTGTSKKKKEDVDSLQSQHDEESDEEKKKKIRQRAAILGIEIK